MRRFLVSWLALCLLGCGGGGGGGGAGGTPTNPNPPTNPPPAVRTLFVNVQPVGANASEPLATQPVVHVLNAQGAVDTADDSTVVSVAIVAGTGAAGAQLTGTTSVTVQDGVAAFADIVIDMAGSDYQLRFSADDFTAVDSETFDVAAAPGTGVDVTFQIDSQQDVRPISRFIYGMNFAFDEPRLANLTLARSGGNRMTAYNWETNASNAGEDWFNQNDDFLGGGEVPGGAVTPLIDAALAAEAAAIVTVPMIGYVAADKNGGGDVNQTPNYLTVRFHQSLARKPSGALQYAPDTSDGFVFQDEWVNFLDVTYPAAIGSTTTPIFFSLDNEPDLWHSTHPRLRGAAGEGEEGTNVTYSELIARTIEYAGAIKDVNEDAVIFGPVNYGWQGMIRLQAASDAADRDFLEFYLQQMAQAQASEGRRLLDVLDVHWYPEAQGGGVRITADSAEPAVAAAREQAPRSLWDPTYTETSWITEFSTLGPITLLPRLQAKIDEHYPGTRLAVTEYYYGGGEHISGAIAQADVLGIFGREGVFAAALWRIGETDHRFIYGAFEMFRNFDGANGSFGDTSIRATTSDVQTSSVYASIDQADPTRLVVVCINKADVAQTAALEISHPVALSVGRVYTLTGDSPSPQAQDDVAIAANSFTYTMPANSVTTLVLLP